MKESELPRLTKRKRIHSSNIISNIQMREISPRSEKNIFLMQRVSTYHLRAERNLHWTLLIIGTLLILMSKTESLSDLLKCLNSRTRVSSIFKKQKPKPGKH